MTAFRNLQFQKLKNTFYNEKVDRATMHSGSFYNTAFP